MTPIPEDIMQTARDIMDNACLGDPHVKNGVVKALTADVARAILAERERCAALCSNTAAVFWADASNAEDSAEYVARASAAICWEAASSAIRTPERSE